MLVVVVKKHKNYEKKYNIRNKIIINVYFDIVFFFLSLNLLINAT